MLVYTTSNIRFSVYYRLWIFSIFRFQLIYMERKSTWLFSLTWFLSWSWFVDNHFLLWEAFLVCSDCSYECWWSGDRGGGFVEGWKMGENCWRIDGPSAFRIEWHPWKGQGERKRYEKYVFNISTGCSQSKRPLNTDLKKMLRSLPVKFDDKDSFDNRNMWEYRKFKFPSTISSQDLPTLKINKIDILEYDICLISQMVTLW